LLLLMLDAIRMTQLFAILCSKTNSVTTFSA
jgi:hypothetical protein